MDYRQECLRLLSDTTYYAPLIQDPTNVLLSQIKAMVEEAKANAWTFRYYASTQCILRLSEGYASLRCLVSTWDGKPSLLCDLCLTMPSRATYWVSDLDD
ncbi:hypothetical protein NDU88_004865 [Pleurodeles waltl]|uniref:Uncharacterized protein n=1 Tax=Pleurodeles waltl TaxID=8319 RepID=A0AAV7UI95_PLEWA|nr:hypothetical protein NDU88_004865 [Pleurodeles waltl]